MGVSDRVPLRLPLLEMYVPLKARLQPPECETWAREMRLAGRQVTEATRLSKPGPVLHLLKESSGIVLLGDPGSGKTTLLKFLALRLATGRAEGLELGARLPVLIPLSSYASALARSKKDLPLDLFLARYFTRYFKERGLDLPLSDLFKERLSRGELLFLFDGLDEVRELNRRTLVVEQVQDFYRRHRLAGNKFVLTSRVVGYREVRPAEEGLKEATLVDFDETEIESFVYKWTAAIEKAAFGDTKVAQEEAARERN